MLASVVLDIYDYSGDNKHIYSGDTKQKPLGRDGVDIELCHVHVERKSITNT